MQYFGMELKKINENKTFVKIVSNGDPKLPWIFPNSIINFFIRKFGSTIFTKMISYCKNIKGTPWE